MILAIDPGTEQSAFVVYDPELRMILASCVVPNAELIAMSPPYTPKVVEWVESFALRVGSELFETVYWIGRFDQAFGPLARVTRKQVKLHLLGTCRGGDSDIRAALIERFGPGKAKAVGSKKQPGPLFGLKSHELSALAVAITYAETRAMIVSELSCNQSKTVK